jgi:hypothetical protein
MAVDLMMGETAQPINEVQTNVQTSHFYYFRIVNLIGRFAEISIAMVYYVLLHTMLVAYTVAMLLLTKRLFQL